MSLGDPGVQPSISPGLSVEVEIPEPPAAARVALRGELDGEEVPRLREATVGVPLGRDVHVEAAELTFLDSAGIRALLDLRERALAGGARVTLRPVTHNIHRVLEIVGLLEAFGVDGPA